MFEHKNQSVISRRRFAHRMLKSFAIALALSAVSLAVGMLGYHHLENLSWIDAFLNASMILGGMGPVDAMKTSGGKLFAGCYALYSGLFLIVSMGIILPPILHRLMHKFHVDGD